MMAWIFVQGKVDVQVGNTRGGSVVRRSRIRAIGVVWCEPFPLLPLKIQSNNKIVIIDIHTY